MGGGDTGQTVAEEDGSPLREEGDASSSGDGPAKQGNPLTVELLLRPKDLKSLLDQTTQAERRAWEVGPLLRGRRRPVLLLDSDGLDSSRSWGA